MLNGNKIKGGIMPLIEWSKDLTIGIESIDNQHKKLISIVNTLHDAMQSPDSRDVLSNIFRELTSYTQTHFAYEERLFAQYGYQESTEHKRQHAELIFQLLELEEKVGRYQQEDLTQEVMIFLKGWLTFHILETDKAYSGFLIAKGVK